MPASELGQKILLKLNTIFVAGGGLINGFETVLLKHLACFNPYLQQFPGTPVSGQGNTAIRPLIIFRFRIDSLPGSFINGGLNL